jgi:hypothetical protein
VTVGKQSVANSEHVCLQPLDQLSACSRVTSEAAAYERGVVGHDGPFWQGNTREDVGGFQVEGIRKVVRGS